MVFSLDRYSYALRAKVKTGWGIVPGSKWAHQSALRSHHAVSAQKQGVTNEVIEDVYKVCSLNACNALSINPKPV